MSSHSETCRCSLHEQIALRALNNRRHASYRQLAFAILGPAAPREDQALVTALADHASLLRSASIDRLNDLKAA